MRTAARLRLSPNDMWNLGLVTVFSALLGSRIVMLAGHWHDFLSYPLPMLSISTPRSIDTVVTELCLGIFAGLFYMSVKRMRWLETLDAAAPAWALAQAILMLGCFLAGCNYGRPTDLPWGVVYRSRWALLWNGTPLGVRVHPVQLYLCAVEAVLCVLLLWWLPRRRQPGEIAGAWMMLSGLAQFFLDFYRGDNRLLLISGAVSLTQAIDFCLVIVGALMLVRWGRTVSGKQVEVQA